MRLDRLPLSDARRRIAFTRAPHVASGGDVAHPFERERVHRSFDDAAMTRAMMTPRIAHWARCWCAASLVSFGCAAPEGVHGDDDDTSNDDAWFEVGWGDEHFVPIEDGDFFPIVWGGQGAAMFPMPIRGGGFELPDDPRDYLDERAPLMDLHVDIEGYNTGIGGHFKRIANYPLVFTILDDGTYEFVYVAIILPDDVDPFELEGLPVDLWVQIRPYQREPLVHEHNLVVTVVDNRPY